MGTGAIAPLGDLSFKTACCCEYCSFYLKYPECRGGATKGVCLCVEGGSNFKCLYPQTCWKVESTYCCIDVRAALPCDDDVPMAVGICGIMLLAPGIGKTIGVKMER